MIAATDTSTANVILCRRDPASPQPVVSVIVPNYNYAKYLPQRLSSISAQTFRDFEIIMLDDASSDESLQIMQQYAATEPRVTMIIANSANTGSPFAQWSAGIANARGRYVWIAEADDIADPDFLLKTVSVLDEHDNVCVAYSLSDLIDSSGIKIDNFIEPTVYAARGIPEADGSTVIYEGRSYLAAILYPHNVIYNASMTLFRLSAVRDFDINIYRQLRYIGDWAFWSEMTLHGDIAEVRLRLNCFRKHTLSTTQQSIGCHREALAREETLFTTTFEPMVRRTLASHMDSDAPALLSYGKYKRYFTDPHHRRRRYFKYLIRSLLHRRSASESLPLTYLTAAAQPCVTAVISPSDTVTTSTYR